MAETTIKAPRVSKRLVLRRTNRLLTRAVLFRDRKPAIGIEPMTSRLPREYCFRRSPAGEKAMVGRGLEPHPFGLQPSALPVKLTNQRCPWRDLNSRPLVS